MDFKVNQKTIINNEFQNIISNLKSTANDINQNKDKNEIISQISNILYYINNLNKKVLEELDKSNNQEPAPLLPNNQPQIITIMTEDGEYTGEVKNNIPNGRGKLFYKGYLEGDLYEGEFTQDCREGKGIFYFHDGDRMMGDYHRDKPVGKHVILQKNGNVLTKIFN